SDMLGTQQGHGIPGSYSRIRSEGSRVNRANPPVAGRKRCAVALEIGLRDPEQGRRAFILWLGNFLNKMICEPTSYRPAGGTMRRLTGWPLRWTLALLLAGQLGCGADPGGGQGSG